MSPDPSVSAIPLVRGLPLIGNVREMLTNLNQFLIAQYLHHGPVFRVRTLNREMTILAGPEANAFMKEEGHHCFSSHGAWMDMEKALGADKSSMVGLDGEAHQTVRNGLKPGYVGSTLYRQMPRLIESQFHLIRDWPHGPAFAAGPRIKSLVSSLLGYMATNQAPVEIMDDLVLFFRDLLQLYILKTKPRFMQYMPRWVRAKATALGMIRDIWEERKTHPGQEQDADFVDVVRAFHRKHPELMTENDAVLALIGPFLAGMDTAANITSTMLFHILADPDLKQAVVAEADQAFAAGIPTRSTLSRMHKTRWAAMEALRMYNPAPGQMRTAVRDFTFMGYRIPAGAYCMVAHTVTHYLPAYFPDPYRFDIERYAPARKEHAQPNVYVPYGLGPHTCLGASTADMLYLILTAVLFHHFQLELQPPDQDLRMTMDPLLGPDRHFRIALTGERRPLVLPAAPAGMSVPETAGTCPVQTSAVSG